MHKEKTRKDLRYFPVLALALGVITIGIAGCHNTNPTQNQNATAVQAADNSQDPAEQANLAPAVATTQQSAPVQQAAPEQQTAPPPPADEASNEQPAADNNDYSYNAASPDESYADEPVTYAPGPPPPLPEYDQPECPGPDYIWTPGYWGFAPTGYYWVPGTWVVAPYVEALWTPGYWGFYSGRYLWHYGYWGPHIGFYGGVNYGYGYTGVGYSGGYWNNGGFMYNTAVTRVNSSFVHRTYMYRGRVVNNTRVSYNGGRGGLAARPLPAERVAAQERHMGPLPAQHAQMREAATNRAQWASVNHGRPTTLAAARPLDTGRRAPEATPAAVREQVQREATQRPVAARPANESRPETRPNQPIARPEARPQVKPEAGRPAARPENRVAARPEGRPQTSPARPEARPRPQARPESRPQASPQMRPEARPAPRPEVRQQARPAARPEEARPQARPAPRPEGRPQQPRANDDRRPQR
ncbi:MAG: hypothetical protein WA634_15250 [Silvibacterium sp.]